MNLSVIEAGSGAPLVILHGLLGSARNWGGIATKLGESRRVMAVDMPNHGASPWSESMDYPFMARQIAAFIKARCGGRAAVIGHSMGGKAAMMLALTQPQLVERLVVVDIAPVKYTHTFAPYIKAMRAAPIATAQRRGDVELAMHGVIDDARVRAFLMQNLDGQPGSYRWRPNLAVLGAAMDDILGFPTWPMGRITMARRCSCTGHNRITCSPAMRMSSPASSPGPNGRRWRARAIGSMPTSRRSSPRR